MTLDYYEFLDGVQRDAALSAEDDAVRAVQAALQTLAERLSGAEARDVARYLPEPVRSWLHDGDLPEPFGVEEYLHRVARREGVPEPDAVSHALAVFAALRRDADPDEILRLERELPKDFRALFVAAEAAGREGEDGAVVPPESLILRVVAYGDVDVGTAWAAADAVLDALGERLSSGQVEDLAARLPDELSGALRRGDERSKGRPARMSLEEFVQRIAELEEVPPEEARRHARAVFFALRDVVGEKELRDAIAQLPEEYAALMRDDGDGARARPRARGGATRGGAARAADGAGAGAGAALTPETVELHAPADLPPETEAEVRESFASLQRFTERPLISARLTLRLPKTRPARSRWIADASILLDGRLLAAHATGPTPVAATDAVVDRLRRQIRRVVGADIAMRNEPRVLGEALSELPNEAAHRPEADLLPTRPGDTRLIHRVVAGAGASPMTVTEAAADLIDRDHEFRLFRDADTGAWLLVYRRDDDRIGVVHPRSVPLPDMEDDVLVVEPPPHPEPLTLEEAEAELRKRRKRFVFFIDEADGLPKVLYLRHDGDYGLVEPEHELQI